MSGPTFDRRQIWKGFAESVPVMVSVFAFGLVYGVLAVQSGLTVLEAFLSCVIVLAGMSQFASLPLFAAGISPLTIIGTTFIINMRHLIMGASIAGKFTERGLFGKAAASYFLIDESFAMATAYAEKKKGGSVRDYMIGSGIAVFAAWNIGTILGALFGNFLGDPKEFGLDFAAAAAFIGLLVPQIRGKGDILVLLIAAALSVGAYLTFEGSWYILITGITASLAGALVTRDEK
ncbi:MAG: AzlC family ABC transporter permease [Deltaproteobacteria bacterium]|nr:AzlC family ABC transporter permease [Candidatus Zymogenaceae bacterium]